MVRTLPRVVVAAPATGQGKTTVATGLMAALAAAGHSVSGHKVGPDYIDPGYHALACGRPGRNLDPHLVGEDLVSPLLLHGARGADVAVVEGVMGLYDGRIGGDGFSSTAHVAALTRTPVVLVVDISRSSRSIGALVHGMATWDPTVSVAGVILNQAGSARHADEVRSSISLPVLGVIPRDASIATPSRHLGLVTAAERGGAAEVVARLAEVVTEHVDLDAVLAIARSAPDLAAEAWAPPLVEEVAQRPARDPRPASPSPPAAPSPSSTPRPPSSSPPTAATSSPSTRLSTRASPPAPPASTSAAASPRSMPPTSPPTPRCSGRSARPSSTGCRRSRSAPGCSTCAARSTRSPWPACSTPTR